MNRKSARLALIEAKHRVGDAKYWLVKSHEDRLAAVEEIRQEYHGWTDRTHPRLHRVCRITTLDCK